MADIPAGKYILNPVEARKRLFQTFRETSSIAPITSHHSPHQTPSRERSVS